MLCKLRSREEAAHAAASPAMNDNWGKKQKTSSHSTALTLVKERTKERSLRPLVQTWRDRVDVARMKQQGAVAGQYQNSPGQRTRALGFVVAMLLCYYHVQVYYYRGSSVQARKRRNVTSVRLVAVAAALISHKSGSKISFNIVYSCTISIIRTRLRKWPVKNKLL